MRLSTHKTPALVLILRGSRIIPQSRGVHWPHESDKLNHQAVKLACARRDDLSGHQIQTSVTFALFSLFAARAWVKLPFILCFLPSNNRDVSRKDEKSGSASLRQEAPEFMRNVLLIWGATKSSDNMLLKETPEQLPVLCFYLFVDSEAGWHLQ